MASMRCCMTSTGSLSSASSRQQSAPRLRLHQAAKLRSLHVARSSQEPASTTVKETPVAGGAPSTSYSPSVASSSSTSSSSGGGGGGGGNAGLAAAAVAAGVLFFAATRLLGAGHTLAELDAAATPLEVAYANNRPTVVEFYANWCEVCRELANDEFEVEAQYRDRVNFVMLNVENTLWAPEVAEYGVNGIPHFVFLDAANQPLAAAVGRVPVPVLEGNVAALAEGKPLPFARVQRGETSSLLPPSGPGMMSGPSRAADPRAHG